jgi:hypothetical protein
MNYTIIYDLFSKRNVFGGQSGRFWRFTGHGKFNANRSWNSNFRPIHDQDADLKAAKRHCLEAGQQQNYRMGKRKEPVISDKLFEIVIPISLRVQSDETRVGFLAEQFLQFQSCFVKL